MRLLKPLAVVISATLLAAHFLRAGLLVMVVFCLAFPLLLLFRNKWATRAVQAILALGALEWVRTLLTLIDERQAAGESWSAAAIILCTVALFNIVAAMAIHNFGVTDQGGD